MYCEIKILYIVALAIKIKVLFMCKDFRLLKYNEW